MSFGNTLRELRKHRGLNQKALADIAGIDFTYLSKVENDRTPPPSEPVIRAMAEALDTDADELIRLAGKVPSDLTQLLLAHPEAMKYLRAMEGDIQSGKELTLRAVPSRTIINCSLKNTMGSTLGRPRSA